MKSYIKQNFLYLPWIAALLATLGSLYASEVLHLVPCILCWFQRIAMYPLVIILGVGILRQDKKVHTYALPLVIIGGLISIYHNLLYFKILPEAVAPCTSGVSCTDRVNVLFGIPIPLLSLMAFIIITALLIAYARINSHEETSN